MSRLAALAAAALLGLLAGCHREPAVWREPTTGMEFVRVPAAELVMGSPADEPGREPGERQHAVRLTRAIDFGRFEVTQRQWRLVMGTSPSRFAECGDDCPVESVSWHDAREFAARLSARSGERFRLPTEAEWERACRAGTATAYSSGAELLPSQANVDAGAEGGAVGAGRAPRPVGSYPPNAWGLFDLHGNVWEWTVDEHCPYPEDAATDPVGACGAELRVIRGGSWHFGADSARCALRYTHRPQDTGFSLGFRLVREVP